MSYVIEFKKTINIMCTCKRVHYNNHGELKVLSIK